MSRYQQEKTHGNKDSLSEIINGQITYVKNRIVKVDGLLNSKNFEKSVVLKEAKSVFLFVKPRLEELRSSIAVEPPSREGIKKTLEKLVEDFNSKINEFKNSIPETEIKDENFKASIKKFQKIHSKLNDALSNFLNLDLFREEEIIELGDISKTGGVEVDDGGVAKYKSLVANQRKIDDELTRIAGGIQDPDLGQAIAEFQKNRNEIQSSLLEAALSSGVKVRELTQELEVKDRVLEKYMEALAETRKANEELKQTCEAISGIFFPSQENGGGQQSKRSCHLDKSRIEELQEKSVDNSWLNDGVSKKELNATGGKVKSAGDRPKERVRRSLPVNPKEKEVLASMRESSRNATPRSSPQDPGKISRIISVSGKQQSPR